MQNKFQELFRALRHRNFALFFIGQGTSLVGTWMQQLAMSWLVYRLTGSALLLGTIAFCTQFPTFLFSSFAGVFADRWNRQKMVMTTQALAMVQAFLLAYLTLSGKIQVWHLVALGLFLGGVNAVDIPTRQAFMLDMLEDKQDLGNAIALNSSLVNVARLLGPSIGGILIAWVGEGWCFLINALSFLAVLAALMSMRIRRSLFPTERRSAWKVWREGLHYVYSFKPIRILLCLLALIGLLGTPYGVLMPIFADKILHGGAHTLGFLMSASGFGALSGAIHLASRKSVLGLGRLIAWAAAITGTALIAFSLSHVLWLSMACIWVSSFGMITEMAASNTIIQTIVDDDKRGRVMSFFAMAFLGTAPLGSLIAGTLADHIGAPHTMTLMGCFCLLGGAFYVQQLPTLREVIRPIYLKMGILRPGALPTQIEPD